MRVLSFTVDGWVDPAAAFVALYREADNSVWLDSGIHAEQGISVIGVASRAVTASVTAGTVTTSGAVEPGTIFDFLRRNLADYDVPAGEGFQLGWIGWLGYELRAQTMGQVLAHRSRYPDAALAFLDRAIVFDHASRVVELRALGEEWTGELLSWRDAALCGLRDSAVCEPSTVLSGPSTPVCGPSTAVCGPSTAVCETSAVLCGSSSERGTSTRIETSGQVSIRPGAAYSTGTTPPPAATWAHKDSEYLAMIRECQAAIAAGDAYQLCLTTQVVVDIRPDPVDSYLRLRESSPTHHGGFIRIGEVSLLSATPEQFIAVSPNGEVSTKPIKGTRRRGNTVDEDRQLRDELERSDKERAENLMIVDLMRNDIGRVSEVGSVRVTSLLAVESYAQVHQLVSTISGRLAAGVTGMDAVESCFPAGSMTGAPKRSATDILDRLEGQARGIYSGAFGYFSLDGRIDLAMVIRSIILDPDGATVGSGGGITALSVPEEELDEVYLKAAALLTVLGVQARPSVR